MHTAFGLVRPTVVRATRSTSSTSERWAVSTDDGATWRRTPPLPSPGTGNPGRRPRLDSLCRHGTGGANGHARRRGCQCTGLLLACLLSRLVHVAGRRRAVTAAPARRPAALPPRAAVPRPGAVDGAPRRAPSAAREPGGWPAPATDRQIEGYATTSSGLPGAPVALRVSTRRAGSDVRAYRIGGYRHGDGQLVWGSRRLPGHAAGRPGVRRRRTRRTVVAPWRTSAVVDTDGWAPGLYVFKLRTGPAGRRTCRTS